MSIPTLGLALIAKDEEENLPQLLRSIEGAFDQVCLLDTGQPLTKETTDLSENTMRELIADTRARTAAFHLDVAQRIREDLYEAGQARAAACGASKKRRKER